jgi:DNA-binding CsgD family transcriptional regulator
MGTKSTAYEVDRLTRRELDCLRLLAAGKQSKQAASKMGISASTFHKHLASARKKMGVERTAQALLCFQRVCDGAASADDPDKMTTESLQPAGRETVDEMIFSAMLGLTPRQSEALMFAAAGLTVAETARRMQVSPRAVEEILAAARRRMGARTTASAIYRALMDRGRYRTRASRKNPTKRDRPVETKGDSLR